MKDLPHHLKKLNRRVIRSLHREEMAEDQTDSITAPREQTLHQKKKQAKERMKQERLARTPIHPTAEERNQKMKHRTPVFDRINNARPRTAKPTKKKTPRI
jgi:hypothetical protein